jgi:diguanylate cyclase (GGDEF)-like protein
MTYRFGLQARFLTFVVVALLVAALALVAVLERQWVMRDEVLSRSRESIRKLMIERLQEQARAVGANTAEALVNPLYNFDLELIGRIVDDVHAQPDVEYVTVYDPAGAVIHDGTDAIASYGQVMADPLAAAIIHSGELLIQQGGNALDVSSPILLGGEKLGGVRIGYTLASVQRYEADASSELSGRLGEISRRYALGVGALLGLALVLGIGISVVMQHVLIRPIRRLAHAAREIEAGNLLLNLPGHDRHDEIGELVQAFERMTDGIARRDRDIRRIANTDSLTGLANRRAFRETLDAYVNDPAISEFALILADIDSFKPINDIFGHGAGDKVLMRFAERFRQVVNANEMIETKPARLGGDEFVLIARVVPGIGQPLFEIVRELADRLVEEFSAPTTIDGWEVISSASFGLALHPSDGATSAQLMKAADIAMYAAKRAGKNRYCFRRDAPVQSDGQVRLGGGDVNAAQ